MDRQRKFRFQLELYKLQEVVETIECHQVQSFKKGEEWRQFKDTELSRGHFNKGLFIS